MLNFATKLSPLWRYGLIFFISLLLSLGGGDRAHVIPAFLQGTTAIAQPAPGELEPTASPERLVQQGVDFYQAGQFQEAIAQWEAALTQYKQTGEPSKTAIVLENLARTYQQVGQIEQAVRSWEQAIALYQQMGDRQQVGRLLSEQAQTYSRLGQYRQATGLLCGNEEISACKPDSAIAIAQEMGDQRTQVAALGSLGEIYRLMGNFADAEVALLAALEVTQTLNDPPYEASLRTGLGNTYVNQAQEQYRRASSTQQSGDEIVANQLWDAGTQYDQQALEQFQEGLRIVRQDDDALPEMRLLISMIRPAYRLENTDVATHAYTDAIALLPQLPNSQEKVYATLDLATLSTPTPSVTVLRREPASSPDRCSAGEGSEHMLQLLTNAIATAQSIGDRRSESLH